MKPLPLARALTQMLASVKVRVTLAAVAALVFGIGFITLLMIERIERDLRIADIRRESSQAVQTAALLARKVVSLQRALQFTSLELDVPMDPSLFRIELPADLAFTPPPSHMPRPTLVRQNPFLSLR